MIKTLDKKSLESLYKNNIRTVNEMRKEMNEWHSNLSLFSISVLSTYIREVRSDYSESWLYNFYVKNKLNEYRINRSLHRLRMYLFHLNVNDPGDNMLINITKKYFRNDISDQEDEIPKKVLSEWTVQFTNELEKIIFTAPKLKSDLYLFQPAELKFPKKLKTCSNHSKFNMKQTTEAYISFSSLNYKTIQKSIRGHQPINVISYNKGLPLALIQTSNNLNYEFEPNEFLPTYYKEEVVIPQGVIMKYICNLNEVDEIKYTFSKITNTDKLIKIKNKFVRDYNVIDWTKNPLNIYIASPEEKGFMRVLKRMFKRTSDNKKEDLHSHFETPIIEKENNEEIKPSETFLKSSILTKSDLEFIYHSNLRIVNKMSKKLTQWHENLSSYEVCILSTYINSSAWLKNFFLKNTVDYDLIKDSLEYLDGKFIDMKVNNPQNKTFKMTKQLLSQKTMSQKDLAEFIVFYSYELNKIILSAPSLEEDVYLLKGINNKNYLSKDLEKCNSGKKYNISKTFVKNFNSTTTNPRISEKFIDNDTKCCVNLIRYKKGMPFAMIQNEEDEGKVESIYKFKINKYLRTWGEEEVLLPQGLNLDYVCIYEYDMYGGIFEDEDKDIYINTEIKNPNSVQTIKNKFTKSYNVIDTRKKPYKTFVRTK